MNHARDMADTVTTQETEIVFIGSRHWVQLLGFREEICVKTQLLPRCWCCRLYRRVSMWQQSHYRTMVQGISSAGVTDLTPPSPSWSHNRWKENIVAAGGYGLWKPGSGYTDMQTRFCNILQCCDLKSSRDIQLVGVLLFKSPKFITKFHSSWNLQYWP